MNRGQKVFFVDDWQMNGGEQNAKDQLNMKELTDSRQRKQLKDVRILNFGVGV